MVLKPLRFISLFTGDVKDAQLRIDLKRQYTTDVGNVGLPLSEDAEVAR